MNKKVVCFSGGNAIPRTILTPLKKYPVDITSITSMVDNGGSSGQFREDFNVLPPGDIRRHILALSNASDWKKELWNFRFGKEKFDGGHKGHNFANAFIAGLEYNLKDYDKVLKVVNEFMEVKGKVLPATIEQTQIYAELENGEIIKGEDEIDVPKKHDPNLKIKKVYLEPEAKAYQPSLDAVAEADLITIGPGDLYSSSIPCLLMKGMKEAFKKTKAKKIFICNTMTKLGETNNFSVSDFVNEAEKYMGCDFDYVIYNTEIPSKERLEKFKKEELGILDLVKVDKNLDEEKFIGIKIIEKTGPIVHNPEKLVKLLISLI
jgi:uncharacterized cofD-like protein